MSEQITRQPNSLRLPDGKIEVAPRAIATITARAVGQCYGVVGMAPRNLREGVALQLRREDMYRGVEVQLRDDAIVITLYVIIEHGPRGVILAGDQLDAIALPPCLAKNSRRNLWISGTKRLQHRHSFSFLSLACSSPACASHCWPILDRYTLLYNTSAWLNRRFCTVRPKAGFRKKDRHLLWLDYLSYSCCCCLPAVPVACLRRCNSRCLVVAVFPLTRRSAASLAT